MLRRSSAIASSLILLTAVNANAITQTRNVPVTGRNFPATTEAVVGDVIKWNNRSGEGHTTTGNGPLTMWNKNLPDGGSATKQFKIAGTFAYHCNIHPSMTGKIAVNMAVTPPSGATSDTFLIEWATQVAPNGMTYVIEKRAPGSGAFTPFKTTRAPSSNFKTSKAGIWHFRSKVKRTSDGAQVGWSIVRTVSIIPG